MRAKEREKRAERGRKIGHGGGREGDGESRISKRKMAKRGESRDRDRREYMI